MNPTLNPTATDPNDDLVARADERLAHAYEQIARADEQLARVTENLSHMDRGAARKSSAATDRRRGRPLSRAIVGLLLAACIFGAAFVWQSPQTDAVRLMIAQWMPGLVSTFPLPPNTASPSMQANPSASRLAAAATSPAASAQAAQDALPTAAQPPELAQTLQTMARDLANLQNGLEQLKSRQEQLADDNARAIDQLRTSQDQMARDNVKTAEQLKAMASFTARISRQNLQPTTPAAPPRTNAAATRPPAPTRPPPPPQARVQP